MCYHALGYECHGDKQFLQRYRLHCNPSMDTLKSKIYSGLMYVVNGSKSNCMLKGLVSGVMGFHFSLR